MLASTLLLVAGSEAGSLWRSQELIEKIKLFTSKFKEKCTKSRPWIWFFNEMQYRRSVSIYTETPGIRGLFGVYAV